MSDIKLIVVRHGKTDSNDKNKLQGQLNIKSTELNEIGKEQAKEIAKKLTDIKIDKIYCSTLIRAIQTCQYINEEHNLDIQYSRVLMERSYGILEDKYGKNLSIKEKYWDSNNMESKPEKGESLVEFFARINEFLSKIIVENKRDDTVLVVTHSGVSIALEYLLNKHSSDVDFYKYALANCEYRIYELAKGEKECEKN